MQPYPSLSYFAPDMRAKYHDQRVYVYVSAYLFTCLLQKPHVHISPNFLYMLHMTVAWLSSDGNVIGYVMHFRFCGWRRVFI